jgi:hypothetical protein
LKQKKAATKKEYEKEKKEEEDREKNPLDLFKIQK